MRITKLQCFSFLVLGTGLGSISSQSNGLAHPADARRHAVAYTAMTPPSPGVFLEDGRIELLKLRIATGMATAKDPPVGKEHGAEVYQGSCSVCHGADRKGVPPNFPSLIDVSKRFTDAEIEKQIRNGKGRMLAFPDMSEEDLSSLLLFLKTPTSDSTKPSADALQLQQPGLRTPARTGPSRGSAAFAWTGLPRFGSPAERREGD
jgi:mono/diheme cytochrome c family protein